MSVLETPRIYFSGQIAWDPIVTNNYAQFYNETTSEPVFPTAIDKVAAFRAEAIKAIVTANWNPHGTHRSTFFEASISGADLGDGLVQDDKFVRSPANFMGMLVDLEPYGTTSSQLFFDGMSFGIAGGYRIACKRRTRMTSRYINFVRNPEGPKAGVASVIWQTCFSKEDGLRIDAFDSLALQALQNALVDDDVLGITVQFNNYRTLYYNEFIKTNAEVYGPSSEFRKLFAAGGWQPNPARSMMVGVIGLWRRREPVNEPLDRTLVTTPDTPKQAPAVGGLHARFNGGSLVLDLSNSISEKGLHLEKDDFGELTVVAMHRVTNNVVALGTLQYSDYDTDAYLATSGIVTLEASEGAAKLGILQLRDASGKVLLTEEPLRALPLTPNLYMNQGDTQNVQWQVYDRGVPAGAGIEVTICAMSADGGTIESTSRFTTDENGRIEYPITGTHGGITPYIAVPGPNPTLPTSGLNTQTNTYMYVRTLPADEEIAQLEPNWENLFEHVLANWKAMAPCMDNWLDLASKEQVLAYGPMIMKLTDVSAFESFRYMPVTRDLTPGMRSLLYNFFNNPANYPPPPPKAAAPKSLEDAAAPAEPQQPESFVTLNRKMRS